ncbi:hypothetical protein EON82_09680 [bacterium]|nr:MAG: hypothetical protein EON82_09680 [bacterium]
MATPLGVVSGPLTTGVRDAAHLFSSPRRAFRLDEAKLRNLGVEEGGEESKRVPAFVAEAISHPDRGSKSVECGGPDDHLARYTPAMRKLHPLSIAVPAFLIGALATAGMTTTARAQERVVVRHPTYHVVTDEGTMNKYAAEGYEVKEANATATHV